MLFLRRAGSKLYSMRFGVAILLAVTTQSCAAPQSKPQPQSIVQSSAMGKDGAAIYARACAACHDGGAAQAPRREALAALPAARIKAALETGIMKSQAAGLDADERLAVAAFLSKVQTSVGARNAVGQCNPDDLGVLSPIRVGDWGMGLENSRAVDGKASGLSVRNASRLKLDWVFAYPDGTRSRVQPTLAGDTLFTADQTGAIYALNAASGCVRWRVQTAQEIRSALVVGTNATGGATTLYFGDIAGNVHALDIAGRKLIWSVRPELHAQATITGTLRLFEGKLFVPISSLEVVAAMNGKYACCTFRGAVAALDAATGRQIWKTYTIDEEASARGSNREGAEMFGPSGAPVWSSPTIDKARGRLYIGTGENYSHPASDKSDSVIALDLATGKILWSFQALSQDVWNAACAAGPNCPINPGPDYDFGAPPILVDRKAGGSLVLAGQKSGYVFALDPDRGGALVWKAKPGRGGIMGGVHWGMTAQAGVLYVPVSDLSAYPKDALLAPQGGLHALDVETGAKVWSTLFPDRCGNVEWRCAPGVSAAAMLAGDVILTGSLDGLLRAVATKDGEVLWEFDTNLEFQAVNGVRAFGGSIDSSGPIASGGWVYATSGYDKFGQKAGNLLLAFKVQN